MLSRPVTRPASALAFFMSNLLLGRAIGRVLALTSLP
jgi:hypothetical protein